MKRFFVLFGLMMIAATAANAATTVPPGVADVFDTVINIVLKKGVLLGGIGIVVVGAIIAFINKTWSPLAYAIIGVVFMVLASPLVTSLIKWGDTATFATTTTTTTTTP